MADDDGPLLEQIKRTLPYRMGYDEGRRETARQVDALKAIAERLAPLACNVRAMCEDRDEDDNDWMCLNCAARAALKLVEE